MLTAIRDIRNDIRIGLLNLRRFSAEQPDLAKREQEKAGTRLLLAELLGAADYDLVYSPEKKPSLRGSNLHLSISHSHDWLAILLDEAKPTGIDIELLRDKVLTVRHKFLNAAEAERAGADIVELSYIWAAKEAMYKAYGLKGVDFAAHLSVEPGIGNTLMGRLNKPGLDKRWLLKRERLEDYVMVYVLDEI